MKHLPMIAGILLGLLFALASVPVLFNLMPMPKLPEGTSVAMFSDVFWATGYMKVVKAFELLGAILVAIPRTRNFGLLILGPIIVNILAFHVLIDHGQNLHNPMAAAMVVGVVVLALYLLWAGRKKFAGLMN